MTGAERIQAERIRQVEVEGWTPEHDDEHERCQLLDAALCYVGLAGSQLLDGDGGAKALKHLPEVWPWALGWWKPSGNPIRNLEKAGALIAAEIDRLQRR